MLKQRSVLHILTQGWSEKLAKRYRRFCQKTNLEPPWQILQAALNLPYSQSAFWRYQHEHNQAPLYQKNFYCADFTHIQLGMTGGRAEKVLPSYHEALTLRQDLQKEFSGYQWQNSLNPHRGYLSDPKLLLPEASPLPWLYGREIRQEWQAGFRDFYRLQTEIEMFLATHPINQQRQHHGLLTANALWFWGKSVILPKYPSIFWQSLGSVETSPWLEFAAHLAALPQENSSVAVFLWAEKAESARFTAFLKPGQTIKVIDYSQEKIYHWPQRFWWFGF